MFDHLDPQQIMVRDAERVLWNAMGLSKIEKDYNPKTGSQQLTPEQELAGFAGLGAEIIRPPIDMKLWANWLTRCTRLARSVRTIARNTVGIGFDVVPVKPFTHETSDAEKKSVLEEAQRVTDFLNSLNPNLPFSTLMENEAMDEEATGNGYIEFTRSGDGTLLNGFQVPSITVRILREDRGYVQVRGGLKRYFRKLGDERVMDARNGKFQGEVGFNQGANDPRASLPIQHRATEVMHFPLYSPASEIYGLPRFIPAGAAMAGNWLAAKRNVVFFKHDAVPRAAVLVSGGILTKESLEEMQAYFQEGQGEEQAHRLLVLQTEVAGGGVDDKNQTRIDIKPFTVGVNEDASFLNYRIANDEEVREAMGLSEVYFKSGKLTKASAVVAKATTDEQEFAPARGQKEHQFNQRVLWGPNGLGASRVKLVFKKPETSDPTERAQVEKIHTNVGSLTVNEIRRANGLEPYAPDQKWANWPMPIAALVLEGKAEGRGELIGIKDPPLPRQAAPVQGDPPAKASDKPTAKMLLDEAESLDSGQVFDVVEITRSFADSIRKLPGSPPVGSLEPSVGSTQETSPCAPAEPT